MSLLAYDPRHLRFIQQTFDGIFFTIEDLRFLDQVSWQVEQLGDPFKKAIAVSGMVRSSIKRYHFLEGLSLYWKHSEIVKDSKVKKLKKRLTPFSYRRTAVDAFSGKRPAR